MATDADGVEIFGTGAYADKAARAPLRDPSGTEVFGSGRYERKVRHEQEPTTARKKGGLFRRRDDGVAVEGRPPLMPASVGFIMTMEAVALIGSWVVWGLPFWVVLQFAVAVVWMMASTRSPAAAMIVANGLIGMAFAHYLFGFPVWPSTVIGVVAVAMTSLHFTGSGGLSGDANPVPYVVAIVATRAYLAVTYTSITAVGDVGQSIFTWLTIFVLGIIPDVPVVVNVLLFIVLNGTLALYLTLLVKRIVNPLSN